MKDLVKHMMSLSNSRGKVLLPLFFKRVGVKMWSEIKLIVLDRFEKIFDNITEVVKKRLIKVYSNFLFSIVSTFLFCYALSSLFTKLANQLDQIGVFVWTPSMTLFLLVALGSFAGLRISLMGVEIDHRVNLHSRPREAPFKRVSQQPRKYRSKRRSRKSR